MREPARLIGSAICVADAPLFIVGDASHLVPHGLREPPVVMKRLIELERGYRVYRWEMILHGCYRVDFAETSAEHIAEVQAAGSWPASKPHLLRCPSGKIAMANFWLEIQANVCVVEPGLYRVAIDWDLQEEERHWELTSIDEYPARDGPDGVFYFVRTDEERFS